MQSEVNLALKSTDKNKGGCLMAKNIAVYGIYRTRQMVERAVEELKVAGFRNTDISVLFPESGGTKDFAVEKDTKAPEGQ